MRMPRESDFSIGVLQMFWGMQAGLVLFYAYGGHPIATFIAAVVGAVIMTRWREAMNDGQRKDAR